MKRQKQKNRLYGKANYDDELVRGFKILVTVVVLIGIIYFATAFLTGEIKFNNKKTEEKEEVTIQYDEIVAGQSFTRKDTSYYVLYYNFTDKTANDYLHLKDNYLSKEDSLNVYIVDLDKVFNQSIIKDKDDSINEKPTSIKDLKVDSPTLLKFSKGKVTKRVVGKEKIENYFEQLID